MRSKYRGMEQDSILNCRTEFKVDIARMAHIEMRQLNSGIGHSECHHIVEEIVTFAHQRTQCVSSLFFI